MAEVDDVSDQRPLEHENRAADEALRTSEARLRLILRTVPDGILIFDAGGRIIAANPALERLTGAAAGDVVGQLFTELVTAPPGPVGVAPASPASGGRRELLLRRADGTRVPVAISIGRAGSGGGEVFVAVVHDLQPERQIEERTQRLQTQLRQVQQMEALGQLAGGVAHDFNNILTAILGNAELLRDALRAALPAGHPAFASIDQIEQAGARAAALTRQLLAFSRRPVVHLETVDLNRVLAGLEKLLRCIISEEIALTIRPAPTPVHVRADVGQLEHVVLNLVVNARDAMPEGGALTIEGYGPAGAAQESAAPPAVRAAPHVLLVVRDTGCGMDAATLERIFEPFFTTKPLGAGTGLGLATVHGIVTQFQGHIAVDSDVGRGTTVRVWLPLQTVDSVAAAGEAGAGAVGGGDETILICEDEHAVRELLEQVLRTAGYTVLTAPTVREALELAEGHAGRLDLLVTDVIMPEMNGRRLADALRARRPDLSVLYVSGYATDVLAVQQVLVPDTEFLAKPFTRPTLLRRVRAVLDRARGAQTRE